MGMLARLLTLPVSAPVGGVLWIARKIEEEANAERWDRNKITGALSELELELDLGAIDVEEYDAREAVLLQKLKELQEVEND
ncbi:Gas vesicle protein G [Enhydrobacter aerosaccus]|uniref:Gas vesicle protein G n=1 Tax=Enhydrobacter aerosaccus TaxID=225324 RepID=A0A1T4LVQ2_9HYPH|nr:gas vesicle protein GvpG [Enhydrobacter aerosaccus]SJZ58737.1 Gas vesicle protein G [Enhydrobacter aerosaccus]